MKRRLLATFLSLCLLVGLLPTVALAEESPASETQGESSEQQATATDSTHVSTTDILSGNSTDGMSGYCGATSEDEVYWALTKNGETVTIDEEPKDAYTLTISGTGRMMDMDVLGVVDENTPQDQWTKDTRPWGANIYNITRVDVKEGVLNIGKRSLKCAKNLVEVNLPHSMEQIGYQSFHYCNQLKDLTIPSNVNEIMQSAFQGTGIESVVIPGSVKIVGPYAFFECSNLSSVKISDGVEQIGTQAFALTAITDIEIPDTVNSLGAGAFYSCQQLVEAVLPSSLSEIPKQLFQFSGIQCLSLPDAVTKIGDNAFLGAKLDSIFIPQSVSSIGDKAFTTLNDKSVIYLATQTQSQLMTMSNFSIAKTALAITNGGTFAEDTVFKAGEFATPTRTGYILNGWYTKDGTGDDWGEKVSVPTAGQTYYAKWIDLGFSDVSLQYQGTQTFTAPDGVTFSDWQTEDPDIAAVENGTITAKNVGETTITATATYNGNTAEVSVPVEVIPRVLTYTLAGDDTGSGSITYNYSGGHHALADSLTFKWKDDPSTVVELEEGTDINYTYAVSSENGGDGTARTYDYLPMPVGTYDNVKFNLLNENYTFALADSSGTRNYLEITVNVVAGEAQRAYLASAAPKADQNFVYTGQGVLPVEGTLNAYEQDNTSSDTVDIGTFTINIEGLNGTTFHSEVSGITAGTDLSTISDLDLPTEPGTYIITASAASNTHYLYKSLVFTISKATVTIKADDKSVYVGDEMPEWTCTVSGLASGDNLTAEPTLTCNATDTNTAGTYTITPSGGEVNTAHYTLAYENGTLTVSTRSSGGGGSSSSNVSGSGDDVSISASGGSVTSSQMESAVNKADEGSTITIKATSSTTVTLPVGGMADAADNDNDVLLDLRYGEVTMSARAIAGMTDGVSSNDKIKVSVANQTSSKNETISDLLDKGAAVFDVTVEVDGVEIHSFDGTLTITLTVSNLSKISDPHVLHILTNGTKEYYAPDRISGNTITVTGIRNLSTFAVIPGSEVPQSNPFTDVSTSDYYYDAVLWAADNGVTGGTSATTFSPNVTVTRAQMVTFLWRAHGSPKATGANPFTDVSTSDYYYDAVLWAVANGVTNGTSATTFSPDAPVTRAQAVTFQWRAAGSPVVSGSSFGDVAADAYYVNAVTWAVANGITNGTSATTFSPDVVVSRAQAVTFLHRELG